MTDLVLLAALVGLVVVALIVRRRALQVASLVILAGVLLWREMSIDVYFRTLIAHRDPVGQATDPFRDGALAILDYCKATRSYVVVSSVLIVVLGLGIALRRGVRRRPTGSW